MRLRARARAESATSSSGAAGASGLDVASGQLDLSEDRGEQVVEVVGEPSGHQAERLQPLRLAQLHLDLFPLGDVEEEHQHGRATQVLDGAGHLLHRPDTSGDHHTVGDGPDRPGDLG